MVHLTSTSSAKAGVTCSGSLENQRRSSAAKTYSRIQAKFRKRQRSRLALTSRLSLRTTRAIRLISDNILLSRRTCCLPPKPIAVPRKTALRHSTGAKTSNSSAQQTTWSRHRRRMKLSKSRRRTSKLSSLSNPRMTVLRPRFGHRSKSWSRGSTMQLR